LGCQYDVEEDDVLQFVREDKVHKAALLIFR